MKPLQSTPLWRDANRLLLGIEEAVRHFPQYHKYAIGTDLRRQTMGVCRLIVRAYHDKTNREIHVLRLVAAGSPVQGPYR